MTTTSIPHSKCLTTDSIYPAFSSQTPVPSPHTTMVFHLCLPYSLLSKTVAPSPRHPRPCSSPLSAPQPPPLLCPMTRVSTSKDTDSALLSVMEASPPSDAAFPLLVVPSPSRSYAAQTWPLRPIPHRLANASKMRHPSGKHFRTSTSSRYSTLSIPLMPTFSSCSSALLALSTTFSSVMVVPHCPMMMSA